MSTTTTSDRSGAGNLQGGARIVHRLLMLEGLRCKIGSLAHGNPCASRRPINESICNAACDSIRSWHIRRAQA